MLCFYKYYLQFCKTVHEMFLQEFKKIQISHSVCVLLSAGSSLPRVYGGFKKGTREGEESNQHMASIDCYLFTQSGSVCVYPACVFLKIQPSVWHASGTRKLRQTQMLQLLTVLLTYDMRYR